MGGVTKEEGLEGWKMQKHVHLNVDNGALISYNVNEEQVQTNVEVGETFTINLLQLKLICKKLLK